MFIVNITKKHIITVAIILILCILIAFLNIPIRIQKIIYKKDYQEYVQKYSQEYDVDENLVYKHGPLMVSLQILPFIMIVWELVILKIYLYQFGIL